MVDSDWSVLRCGEVVSSANIFKFSYPSSWRVSFPITIITPRFIMKVLAVLSFTGVEATCIALVALSSYLTTSGLLEISVSGVIFSSPNRPIADRPKCFISTPQPNAVSYAILPSVSLGCFLECEINVGGVDWAAQIFKDLLVSAKNEPFIPPLKKTIEQE